METGLHKRATGRCKAGSECNHGVDPLSASVRAMIAEAPALLVNARRVKRVDPSRTTSLANAFSREIKRRMDEFLKRMLTGVVKNDTFGLGSVPKVLRHIPINRQLSPGAFAFETDASKLEEFDKWLDHAVDDGVLEVTGTGGRFTDDFIRKAHIKGRERAQEEIRRAGRSISPLEVSLAQQTPAERVATLFTRTFQELRGLTDAMKTQLRRDLAQGIAEGRNPREVGRKLAKTVGIAKDRAQTIARTETIRAHHAGNIAEMKRLGIEGITVMAEWKTAGDDRVCASCAGLEGRVFKIAQIEGLIPLHPNCRCVALPLVEGGLPPAGRPDPDFSSRSDGSKRPGADDLYEKATRGAPKPGFDFPNQNPVTNKEVADMIDRVVPSGANMLSAVQLIVEETLRANADLLRPSDGKPGLRGFIGPKGEAGARGESGVDGKIGPKGETGDRGIRGFSGPKGERGETGERGNQGPIGMRGKDGKQGARGDAGRNGKDAPMPDHSLKLNAQGRVEGFQFQKPNGEWGPLIKTLIENVDLPKDPSGIVDVEIDNKRIRFRLKNGDWTRWVRMGGGGGSGIAEAPKDGNSYARKDGQWVLVSGAVPGAWQAETFDFSQTDRTNGYIDLAAIPATNSELIYQNGHFLTPGLDYTLAGVRVTFSRRPQVGHIVFAKYQ